MRRLHTPLLLLCAFAGSACAPGGSARDEQEPRIIKIQIEGCKEASPTPTPLLALAPPPATAGTAATIVATAATPNVPATVLAGAPTPTGADTVYFQRVGELKGMLEAKHFSRRDIAGVDDALTRADVEAAAGRYDEAMRQLGVAENLLRTRKVDMEILNTKLERLSKAVEKIRTSSPSDYAELNRDLQDANTALLVGHYPRARDILWRIDGRLDEIAMRGMPKR